MMDELLNRVGLKYEQLTTQEKETLHSWMEAINQNALTLDSVRNFIHTMRDGIEQELTKTGLNREQDTYLKARLRNCMMLEAMLSTPERAKQAIERALGSRA